MYPVTCVEAGACALTHQVEPLVAAVFYAGLVAQMSDKYRREGKGRCCCFTALAILYQGELKKKMNRITASCTFWNGCFEKWMIIRFTPHQTTTLPKWMLSQMFFSYHSCCKMISATFKYVPLPAERRPLPSLLYLSLFNEICAYKLGHRCDSHTIGENTRLIIFLHF